MNVVLNMMAMGSFLAERLRGGIAEYERSVREMVPEAPPDATDGTKCARAIARLNRRWSCAWCQNGFPRVTLGHKHAAALMATRTRSESIPDARPPWSAFLVDVPSGLLAWNDLKLREFWPDGTETVTPLNVNVEHVCVLADGTETVMLPVAGPQTLTMIHSGVGKGVAGFGDFEDCNVPGFTLLGRLVLGVCMEMTSTTYKGGSLRPQPVKRDPRTGEPRTWTFQLTRDVTVDCRDAVRAYSQGKTHSSPSVQCLVRGHWKQQRCGKSGAERKNIFVEPYWRGPEEAHIALRKHAMKHPDDTTTACGDGHG